MIINTSELSGKALDYSVAMAIGYKPTFALFYDEIIVCEIETIGDFGDQVTITHEYHNRWDRCGHLIEEFNIDFETCIADDDIEGKESKLAYFIHPESYLVIGMHGETHLIAACRAIVAAFIGDTVEVPDELIVGED